MGPDRQGGILEELQMLNYQAARQNSLRRMFLSGMIYGIGFFVGSAIIATIALGALGPWFGEIPWIHNAFVTGEALLRQ